MAGTVKHDYPPDEEIIARAREAGHMLALGDLLGIPRPTIQAHVHKRGLKRWVDAAFAEYSRGQRAAPIAGRLQRTQGAPEVSQEDLLRDEVKQLRQALAKDHKTDVREAR